MALALMQAVQHYSDAQGISYWCLLTLADSCVIDPQAGVVEIPDRLLAQTMRLDIATVRMALDSLIVRGELIRRDDQYQYPVTAWGITAWERAHAATSQTAPKRCEPRAGYVYLFKDRYGLYKIGRSLDPQQRAKDISQPNFPIDVICLLKTNDAFLLERELHESFAEKRVEGEWFRLNEADVDYIKGLGV